MDTITLSAFGIYLAGMLAIGVWCWKVTSKLSDYLPGGRGLIPAVAALWAGRACRVSFRRSSFCAPSPFTFWADSSAVRPFDGPADQGLADGRVTAIARCSRQ